MHINCPLWWAPRVSFLMNFYKNKNNPTHSPVAGKKSGAREDGHAPGLRRVQWYYLKAIRGLPWWRSGWESACQCRGHGFEPWSGKIPHATEQLGPWATTTEPARLEPVLLEPVHHNKRGRDSERPTHHDEEWPPLAATRERPRTETKTRHSQKINK